MAAQGTPPPSADELRRWRALFDHLPALIAFWDRDLRNVTANRAYLEWFGYTPEQMKGVHIREVLGEAVYQANLPYILGALDGVDQHFERTLVTQAGETRHTQAEYIPAREDDDVTGFYVLVTDISAQVESQSDLHEAQSLARMGSYTYNPSSEALHFSPQLLRIMGRDPDGPSPTMAEYLSRVHPDDLALVLEVRETAARGEEYETSYRIHRLDGEVRHLHSRTRQLLDAEGNVVLLRGVMQDESETQRLAGELGVANATLTDLIGVLGHDLRQPMTVIATYLDVLSEELEELSTEQIRSFIEAAKRGSHRLELLLTDILAMVNLDTSALEVRAEPIDLEAVLAEAVSHLSVDVNLAVPPGAQAFVDPTHLQQILANLLSNAVRYGARPYQVAVDTFDGTVRISVRDHGEGVPPDFAPRLFERFTRATTGIAATVSGTGFGLHIIQKLARANHGDLVYEPAEPGSRFVVHLPAAAADDLHPDAGSVDRYDPSPHGHPHDTQHHSQA